MDSVIEVNRELAAALLDYARRIERLENSVNTLQKTLLQLREDRRRLLLSEVAKLEKLPAE